jgi:hypothetical protein
MKSNRGSAVLVVLLILAVLGLLGAGLIAQTRYDTKLMRAQGSFDKMLNLADGSAKYSLVALGWLQVPSYSGQPVLATDTNQPSGLVDIQPKPSGSQDTLSNLGYWEASAWYVGASTDPWDMPGFEAGSGSYHQDRWVARGSASNGRLVTVSQTQVTVTGQQLDSSYNVNQASLFNPSAYVDTTNRGQANAQSSVLVSAVHIVPSSY